ncbi:hypothetical protein JVU11DRAFT_5777 [Chiua virens]|nr:hypothetical protein JVU11DRAFT_5777 [Chiua virens]
MATTSSSNSLTPTSTLSSSPTNNSNGNGGGFIDLFSTSESPPLIVAFLAIGVFIVALSGIFGWRRLSQPQGVVGPPPGATTNRRGKSILLKTKPVFCDLWADLQAAGGPSIDAAGFYRWEHILVSPSSLVTVPV